MRVAKEEKVVLATFCPEDSGISCSRLGYYCPTFSGTPNLSQHTKVDAVTHSFPSPIISCIESVSQDAHISHLELANSEDEISKASTSKVLRDVHISGRLMDDFLELAKENTENDLETCGVLGASLCQASNEEEVFTIQNEHSLFPVGWIHTHPTQSCFMSSVDLHTQYPYQVMVPEAFAIVMAPTDTSRSYGIFRLSDPGGMSVLRECQEEGFHPHKETADLSPIYEHCNNVYTNSNLSLGKKQNELQCLDSGLIN